MKDQTEFVPDKGAWTTAAALVGASTLFYLLFIRQALPGLAESIAGEETWRLRAVISVAGAGGLLGSLLAGWRYRLIRLQPQISTACRVCGAAAALSLVHASWPILLLASLAGGVGLGWLGVVLACGLRGTVGTGSMGRAIGVGIGFGSALAHVPVLFTATPRAQTIVAALVILSVSVITPLLTPQEPSLSPRPEYDRAGLIRWGMVLATLTLLGLAYGPGLRAGSELARSTSWPAVFLPGLAAVAAGAWLDRGRRGALTMVAAVALGLLVFAWWPAPERFWAVLLCTLGLGAAGVALVYYPARSARGVHGALALGLIGWPAATAGTLLLRSGTSVPPLLLLVFGLLSLSSLVTQWREDW